MERSAIVKQVHRCRFDPCRYVYEADQAVALGDRDKARAMIDHAYLAFDLCAAGCEQARARGTESWERSSSLKRQEYQPA
jgi:hypothetical protein